MAMNRHMFASWALEVCPRTLEATGELRVHVHVACGSHRRRLVFNPLTVWCRGCLPRDAMRTSDREGGVGMPLAGIAYMAMPKVCTVFAGCSLGFITDLPVSAQSVFNGVQARKIVFHKAHELFCRIPQQMDRNQDQLALYRAVQGSLAGSRKGPGVALEIWRTVPKNLPAHRRACQGVCREARGGQRAVLGHHGPNTRRTSRSAVAEASLRPRQPRPSACHGAPVPDGKQQQLSSCTAPVWKARWDGAPGPCQAERSGWFCAHTEAGRGGDCPTPGLLGCGQVRGGGGAVVRRG